MVKKILKGSIYPLFGVFMGVLVASLSIVIVKAAYPSASVSYSSSNVSATITNLYANYYATTNNVVKVATVDIKLCETNGNGDIGACPTVDINSSLVFRKDTTITSDNIYYMLGSTFVAYNDLSLSSKTKTPEIRKSYDSTTGYLTYGRGKFWASTITPTVDVYVIY